MTKLNAETFEYNIHKICHSAIYPACLRKFLYPIMYLILTLEMSPCGTPVSNTNEFLLISYHVNNLHAHSVPSVVANTQSVES